MQDSLFNQFLKQYILDTIECDDEATYDLSEEDIKEIIENITYNEHVWEVFDGAVRRQLDNYKLEGEDE